MIKTINELYHDFYKTHGKTPKFLIIHSNSFLNLKREMAKIAPISNTDKYLEMKIITTFDIKEDEFILA